MKYRVYGAMSKRRPARKPTLTRLGVPDWMRVLWVEEGLDFVTGRVLTPDERKLQDEQYAKSCT